VSVALDTTHVRVRALSGDEIARYVALESPLDCAGSFKSEALGIALFDAIETQDPTALVGLPLIATSRLLREAGFQLP
jgi:septum formation protein